MIRFCALDVKNPTETEQLMILSGDDSVGNASAYCDIDSLNKRE